MSTNIPGLEKSDFCDPADPKQRLIWSVFGETKTGKSSFALWGPGPVVVADLDKRLEYVVQGFIKGEITGEPKVIKPMPLEIPDLDPMSRKKDDAAEKAAKKEWEKFLKNYQDALESSLLPGGVRTIVIDTATELFDLRLAAEFGKLMGIIQRNRGGANADFTELIRRGEKYNANVIWLHHAKEEWKDREVINNNGEKEMKGFKTGKWILDGYSKANSIVQVVAKTLYNDDAKDVRERFGVQIIRCGVNSALNGKTYTSLDWAIWGDDKDVPVVNYGPLPYISSLAVEDTIPEDWA